MYKKNSSESQEPRTICTDWAQFSLKGFIPEQKSGFRKVNKDINLKYRGYGHHQWQNVVEVIYKGERLGQMDTHPTTLNSPDSLIFYADNRLQYSAGWTAKIKDFWQQMNLNLAHVGRIDIAVDTPYTNQFDFIQKVTAGKLKLVGGTAFTVEYTNDAKPRYFRFGSRSSDKFMRAYYKRQEIQHSNKQYLEEFWSANNFQLGDQDEVARFEIILKRKELMQYHDINNEFGDLTTDTLHLLEDNKYLAALFNTGKEKFFEFVSMASFARTGNVTRCKRVKILDLSNITSYLLQKVKAKISNQIWSAKITCKQLYQLFLKTNDVRYFAQVEDIMQNFCLVRWFTGNVERFYKDFQHKMASNNFEFLTNYQTTENFGQLQIIKTDAYV